LPLWSLKPPYSPEIEGASQGYEFSSEESEGEENNREVEDEPPDSSSPEGRVKSEGASRLYWDPKHYPIGQLEHRYCSVLFLIRNTIPYIILPIRKEVVMNTAGKGMQMNGYIAGPFQVVLGTHLFTVEIYVAPIEEDMLLGLDFLEANGVSLYSPAIDSLSCAPTLMTELGGTLHPLARNTPASFSLTKRLPTNP
jgi:hypothetical protein